MRSSIKICRICLKFPPAIGGLENHVYELSREQALMGHEVHVIMPYFATIVNGPFRIHVIKVGGIRPMADSPFFGKLSVFARIVIFQLLTIPLLVRLDSKYNFDVFHVHGDWSLAVLGSFIKLLLKKPVFLTIHASMKGGLWSRLGRMGIEPFLIVDKIVTVSEEIKKQLSDAGVPASKISVISSGVWLSRFYMVKKYYLKKDNPTILFVGRLRRVKGVRILIEAFRLVLGAFSQARLLIVGDGPSKAELEELSSKMGLRKHVKFFGTVPHHHIPKYLSMADVFVLPSIETSQEKGEGRPTALMEAMAAGVPVVASRIGGIPEIVKHGKNGLLVKPGDYAELADTIIKVLSDPLLASQLGFEASKSATEYDWCKIAKKVCEVYIEVAREKFRRKS